MVPSNVDASALLTKPDDTKDQTKNQTKNPTKGEAKGCCAMRCQKSRCAKRCHESQAASETACKTSGGCKRGKCCWKAKVAFVLCLPLLPIIVPLCYARYKLCRRNCHTAEVEGKAPVDESKADESKADVDKMDEEKA